MNNHPFDKKKVLCILLCAFLLLSMGLAVLIRKSPYRYIPLDSPADDGKMAGDLERLSEETYDGILLSMHSSRNFTTEDFSTFLAQNILIASHTLLNAEEISQYLDCALASGNQISHIYLCLDPELLRNAVGNKDARLDKSLTSHLYSYIEAHPDISFEVLLPYPHIDYWLSFDSKDLDSLLAVYHTFVDKLSAYPNTKTFFPGGEYWLIVNRDNYEDSLFTANDIITQKLFLLVFCDAMYQIDLQNEDAYWSSLRETVTREKEAPTYYPDLSDWCFVFFGDSILGNFFGSFSIPGYIAGLSDAAVYNCAVGGSSASLRADDGFDFPNVVDSFLEEGDLVLNDGTKIPYGAEFQKDDIRDRRLCFIINFGANDYFSGCAIDNPDDALDVATYKGSLRYCISRLQERFPGACYVVMSPTRLDVASSLQSEPLTAYIEALEEICQEMNLYFMDNYDGFIITEENLWSYLPDGCHPNEEGRLAIAVRIMNFIEEQVK